MEKEKSYHTKQKDELLNLFKSKPEKCFTSREIIQNESISLSEPTVYRLLSKFVADGLVKKFIGDGKSGATYRFNRCGSCEHFHMQCMDCGELFHVDLPILKSVENSIEQNYDFVVDNSSTTLYGHCKNCRRKGE